MRIAFLGLGISAPRDGGSAAGGKGLFTIRDQASFRVEQQLALGSGTQATTSDGTLEVIGPGAKRNFLAEAARVENPGHRPREDPAGHTVRHIRSFPGF